MQPDEKED